MECPCSGDERLQMKLRYGHIRTKPGEFVHIAQTRSFPTFSNPPKKTLKVKRESFVTREETISPLETVFDPLEAPRFDSSSV